MIWASFFSDLLTQFPRNAYRKMPPICPLASPLSSIQPPALHYFGEPQYSEGLEALAAGPICLSCDPLSKEGAHWPLSVHISWWCSCLFHGCLSYLNCPQFADEEAQKSHSIVSFAKLENEILLKQMMLAWMTWNKSLKTNDKGLSTVKWLPLTVPFPLPLPSFFFFS